MLEELPATPRPATADLALESARAVWTDPLRSAVDRVNALMAVMTPEEKLAQLVGVWVGLPDDGEDVAPAQHELNAGLPPWDRLIRHGMGQLTRVFGTAPVEPGAGARALARAQQDILDACRLRIPAVAHEECLSGFTTWRATVFPTPLAWAATFDPELAREAARGIAAGMRAVGVHQGLAPVVDVVRDPRWGRTEETFGEDPYLVAMMGAGYASGLEAGGIVATLKHFAGYSASRAGRNQAPVPIGPREFADVVLPPFEAALRLGGARSVMHSYADVDGVPPASDPTLLTGLLRDTWRFRGTVVADYFGITFLHTAHRVAGSPAEAAALALAAGVDVELPSVRCYGDPLLEAVRAETVPLCLVDRAVRRVLTQKCELGLLDAGWSPRPPADEIDLDSPQLRGVAGRLAERSVVLLENHGGLLPLTAPGSVAVVGPCADDVLSLMGCYAFPNHVGVQHPDLPTGLEIATLLDAVRDEWAQARVAHAQGVDVQRPGTDGIAAAVELARSADVCVLAVGDRSGLFGRGTSGEGCDAADLRLPGDQHALAEAVLDAGTPVVLVVLSGRPYALGAYRDRAAAVVQAFLPGQLGAAAVTGVLSGRVNPSGRLPVQVPEGPAGQPAGYLHPPLGGPSGATALDPTPLYPFGHGLSYTTFGHTDLAASAGTVPTDGELEVAVTVTNTGGRDGADVVQLYLEDPVASVTRPLRQLVGFARVQLPAGASRRVRFRLHTDRFSFTGRDGGRIVEPGELRLRVARDAEADGPAVTVQLTGPVRRVGQGRVLDTPVTVS